MRLLILTTLLCGLATHVAAADDFPCTAYVAVERAEIVAGPGQRFYTTQQLERGTPVEIYREESSGWLAIRPPEGSFSWVPAQFIARSETDGKLGRVKQETGAWIGTSVEQVREHRQEVTLKVGEVVQILGEKSTTGPTDEPQQWFKIAPPAGEFRWIHVRDVSRQAPPPLAVASAEKTAIEAPEQREPDELPIPEPTSDSRFSRVEAEPQRIELAGTEVPLRDIRKPTVDPKVQPAQFSSNASGRTSLSPDGFVPRKRREGDPTPIEKSTSPISSTAAPTFSRPRTDSSARLATNSRGEERRGSTETGIIPAAPLTTGLSGEEIAKQLEQAEVELSLTLAKDKSLWDLASIRQRVERLVAGGSDPTSRGGARLMLEKIKQIEGAFDVEDFGPIERAPGASASAGSSAETSAPASGSLTDPRYDAQGWLKPVVSRQKDKAIAPYAVVDKDGQPLCFVTPSPGLNLQRYLNKSVGLYGRRGYLEELKKPHLTAQRVIELDRQWR